MIDGLRLASGRWRAVCGRWLPAKAAVNRTHSTRFAKKWANAVCEQRIVDGKMASAFAKATADQPARPEASSRGGAFNEDEIQAINSRRAKPRRAAIRGRGRGAAMSDIKMFLTGDVSA
jgi:hypothetical protein